MLLNRILSVLVILGGMLIAGVLYFSLGWNENFDEEHKTPFLVSVWILIPLTVAVSIWLWRKRD